MRFHQGTPPRYKTVRAIERQAVLGLPRNSRLSVTQSAQLVHPTKGLRVRREGIAVPARGPSHEEDRLATRGLCRKILGLLRDLLRKREAADFRREHRARQALIGRLTGWERNQWARAGYPRDLAPFLGMAEARRTHG